MLGLNRPTLLPKHRAATEMTNHDQNLSLAKVLAWRSNWSVADQAKIVAAIEILPDPTFRQPSQSEYVNVWVGDERALEIRPGYLLWPKGGWSKALPADLFPRLYSDDEGVWHELSTFPPRSEPSPQRARPAAICPLCTMEMPANGVCECA